MTLNLGWQIDGIHLLNYDHAVEIIKKDLKISDRVYVCNVCGLIIDRDLQASINLRETKTYKIA